MYVNERAFFSTSGSKSYTEEVKRRASNAFKITMSKSEYRQWSSRSGRHNDKTRRSRKSNSTVVYETEDEIQVEYKKPR